MKTLPKHLRPVLRVLKRHRWPSALTFVEAGAANPFAVTARVRDLRKPKYGGFTIVGKYRKVGKKSIFCYHLES